MRPTAPQTLLLVDDHPRNLVALGALLEPFGHRLLTASGGRAAIETFEREEPDLVLCDFAMPECDGMAVLRAIRSHPQRAETPVVIVTAYAERDHRLQALQAGADDFLEKPIDEPVLVARVRTLLRLKQSRDALESARGELAFQNDALRRLHAEQRELVDFILHDLRVPITALDLALEGCRRASPSDASDLAAALDDACTASRRIARMSEDLVSISQLEDEAFPVRLTHVRVDAVVEDALASCRALLDRRRVDFVARPLANVDVVGDPALLRRVVENLIDNAVRHTPSSGHVRVEVTIDGEATVVISNDGARLTAAQQDRLFAKYARGVDGSATHAGLGLYFCKRAMLAQYGDIEIVDLPDWPTTFRLSLPTADAVR
ncbi:MAG TPA: hybrid sensor histidine kinase/response regulator [Nannocystaceae bacterium]|nr:hybrid sensor histidine kinase/response regulator [Nannocystaceae bacterium]